MLWLPDATRHDYGTSGGSWTDSGDPKGCLHTTEGSGWPSYDSGKKAPHLTVLPIPGKGVQVRQHVAFDRAARALRNPPGGVQTNRDRVYQIELIGTCAKGGPGYYWPDADDAVLADLYRKVIHPISAAFSIPEIAPPWQAYPASFGARGVTNTVRMSGPQFDHYSGWLGHQHVPENDHGDPGAFPWSRMIAAVSGETTQEDDMTPEQDRLLRELHDRLYGVYPQRYYVADADGTWREVDADTPGAKPARGLDELHGNVIVTDVRRAISGVSTLAKATAADKADPAAIAAAVVDAVGVGVAAQVVDALAARLNTKGA